MKRPFSDKRPIGPFVQRSHEPAEVNVYFEMKNLSDVTTDKVEEVVKALSAFSGPVHGVTGSQNNVVSFETVGSQITHSEIMNLQKRIEVRTKLDVDDIEVIW